ncbi:MAG: 3-dehydroquinate synthase [Deferrisomatales bacterium]|nr:3-dehydroquinate synthase [Deferrisomatales bacterium]
MSSDQRLGVNLGERSYPVVIGSGLLQRLPQVDGIAGLLRGRRVFVATDETVGGLHGAALGEGLAEAGAKTIGRHAMAPGEAHKHLGSLAGYWDALLTAGVERGDLLVAFGGGVVGDVAGFAAATCLRGIDVLQVPTTLLAMVDSSVGGKTGIDHERGKNLIGAFHQPAGVVADLELLGTLSRRELLSGAAEMIKAAILGDPALFDLLEQAGSALLDDPTALAGAVQRAVALKARVVEGDERESGQRALLNLGHTAGHAVEVCAGYGNITHGEAVAMGIGFAAALSERLGRCPGGVARRVANLLEKFGYPLRGRGLPAEKVWEALRHDKKTRGGVPKWVLIRDIGEAEWGVEVPDEVVADLLSEVLV